MLILDDNNVKVSEVNINKTAQTTVTFFINAIPEGALKI